MILVESGKAMLFFPLLFLLVSSAATDSWEKTTRDSLRDFILFPRALPTGTCNAQTPCVNAACCGTNGLCGYSPTECGSGNCTSNCDAKAQCGPYAVQGQQNCPLSVCCSKFGFCGSTDDFCGTGCQSGYGGCGPPKRPSCGTGSGSSTGRTIGYYEAWANDRKCQAVSPESLNLNGFTHINFAFAFFDPSSFAIAPMDGNSGRLYNRFTALKSRKAGLQTWISVGGWSFTDPGPTRTAFSTMTSSSSNRAKFISGLMSFMRSYGFDGVDLDWEYPQADDRGGIKADTANYVALVKEMRAAFGNSYGISMTLPTSYWYLQHFDLAGLQPNLDWFNLMAYDLHGVWDAESQFVGPYIAPHTNLTEIDLGLDLLWRAGVQSDKVVLGQAWYGRSFTLKDPSCSTPNGVCQFTGGANAGPCSNAAGILDDQEIQNIVSQNSLTPTWDHTAGVKWITWNSNQWVSYDDADTFAQKRAFANNRCLGGTMVWAMDQVDQSADNNLASISTSQQQDAQQKSDNLRAGITCYSSGCNQQCKTGTNAVTQMNGQPGQVSTADRCPSGQYRTLCCDDGTNMGKCQWRGYRGAGLSCISGCADGETEVVTDTNNHAKNGDQTCTGGLQSYCCAGFKPAPSGSGAGSDLKQKAADAAKAAAEAAAEQLALDVAAKAFCRIAVPALLAPLELLEDFIPIIGEILDIAEIAATPELINLCTKEVEKEGKAEFKVFGKTRTLSGFSKPTQKPSSIRPPESSHTSAPPKSCSSGGKAKRADNDCEDDRNIVCADPIQVQYANGNVNRRECDPGKYQQPCNHYASVINMNPGLYNDLPCFTSSPAALKHVVDQWSVQHALGWRNQAGQNNGAACNADEWPPAYFWTGRDSSAVYIRYCDGSDNQGAGQLWNRFCPKIAERHTSTNKNNMVSHVQGRRTYYTAQCTVTYTRSTFHLDVPGAVAPYAVQQNKCRPPTPDDPGFAMLVNDPWYVANANYQQFTARYANAPTRRKRAEWFDPEDIIFDDGNSTRKATDEELEHEFGFVRCADETCSHEKKRFGIASAITVAPPKPSPLDVSTAVVTVADTMITQVSRLASEYSKTAALPRQT